LFTAVYGVADGLISERVNLLNKFDRIYSSCTTGM